MTRNICIEKICRIPLDFKTENKSAFNLAIESSFSIYYKDITVVDIKDYLSRHLDLILAWDIWSQDKRTNNGFYLFISDARNAVGFMNSNGQNINEQIFDSPVEACAEFILKEVSSILADSIKT